ncbi:MAG: ThiF family adenylyltransferase [Candidatus Dormibacteria bacterium]
MTPRVIGRAVSTRADVAPLDDAAIERYSRQLILAGVGEAGQARLAAARVLVVGAGALGAPVIHYLAAAGTGELEVWDRDRVELSNLARQPVHGEADLGSNKAESACASARAINGTVRAVPVSRRLEEADMAATVTGRTVVCDATDDLETKFALNDACVATGVPLVHAAILEFGGQLTAVVPGRPCLRCLFGSPPPPGSVPGCAQAGILGPVAAVVGGMQAVEAMKLILQVGAPLAGSMLVYDALGPRTRRVQFKRDPDCAGPHPDRE